MLYSLLFIFGLIVGSFLNVVSFRYDSEKGFQLTNLGGRSHCPHCGKTLSWYELVPVFSFIFQKGRCRACGTKLSWQYPLVELATGLIFLLPLYLYNPIIPNSLFIIQSVIWTLVFMIFLLIWTIDFRLYLIPDELNILVVLLGAGRLLIDSPKSFLGPYALLFGLQENLWLNHLVGAAVGAGLVGLILLLSRGRGMGMGDLKLLAALGFFFGWPDILMIFMLASLIGAAVSLVLMALGRKNLKSIVPFAPFLILGAVATFFFSETLLANYFNFFGSI